MSTSYASVWGRSCTLTPIVIQYLNAPAPPALIVSTAVGYVDYSVQYVAADWHCFFIISRQEGARKEASISGTEEAAGSLTGPACRGTLYGVRGGRVGEGGETSHYCSWSRPEVCETATATASRRHGEVK
jgi:hypothetical protein